MTNLTKETDKPKDCDDLAPGLLLVAQAREKILGSVSAIKETEEVAIRDALSRVLAEDVQSTINVPSHTNSAMDGYALAGSELPSEGSGTFFVVGTVFAGAPLSLTVNSGECVRIMTGGKIPNGADTVIMQEHVTRTDGNITITADHKTGQNVRQAGEDLATGETVFHIGKQLMPADIGMLASIGRPTVKVFRKIKVAFFSTGDELCQVGKPLGDGQIYDSNRYTLFTMLKRLNVDIIDMGVIPDQRDLIEQAFQEASKQADVLVTSGGVSVGEADYVKETLENLGQVGFWRMAMKPGKPLAFGRIPNKKNGCDFFGLPGNPVSAMVTFYQFVQPALQQMMGIPQVDPLLLKVKCISDIKRRPGRLEYQRGFLTTDENGESVVESTGQQGSGILSSMGNANCFIVLPLENEGVKAGEIVTVQPFAGLI
jgi:molybdopterin molybdotransferase